MTDRFTLHEGDNREVLKGLPSASVDAIVTDPPYGLSATPDVAEVLRAWLAGREYGEDRKGFMGKAWDGFVPGPAVWRQCYRVLKPGGYLLAFFGTRTEDLGSIAIRLAGFERRDLIAWLYGSGFPKSLDLSKAIDKAAGAEREVLRERYTVKRIKPGATVVAEGGYGKQDVLYTATDSAPATPEAAAWEGWGTALKPALEPIVFAQKPLSERTYAANVLKHGVGGINVDGCRVATDDVLSFGSRDIGDGVKYGRMPVELQTEGQQSPLGRWPANVVHDGSDEVEAGFPAEAGAYARVRGSEASAPTAGIYGEMTRAAGTFHADSGSAARFFYSAKADAEDRLGSKHPTVKPVDLMAWLVRLVTPPGGVVLDPFAGSGTTGAAAVREGVAAILIEREADHCADIRIRLDHLAGLGCHSGQLKARNKKPKGETPLFGSGE